MQVAVLFLLKCMLWQPLHGMSHLSSKLIETSQIHEKNEHLHFDSSDYSESKTSLPLGKKYQWQLGEDCCYFVRDPSLEQMPKFDKQTKFFIILYRKPFKIKYIGIELLNKNQLICEFFIRGPPTLLLQS